ncbi:cobalt-factor II C(20)-methyltransferase [Clostridium uliginosum]|uniref:Cobalt-precorrin-2 C(20)-methyltransferase n=1 Tax=Clostridium uliginosum TaxID=119641 RepID=A0A1I1P7R2_9CLOT|nr:cobalt-factor II C(20)-methyltransferase [Clostridium uliginosum]SFD02040.1 precorrin-2/cobalt-factor-2 C20-methyltransferase [Clostridium uliginosum]
MAVLYGVGVGPGDKELITVKGVKIIQKCDVIVAPTATEGGESIAFETSKEYVREDAEVAIMHFPMGGKDRLKKSKEAYEFIEKRLAEGKNVAFLTIGDPYVYSTYIHMLSHVKEHGFEVNTIPGITSFCAAASLVDRTLVIGDEKLVVMPATKVNEITDEKFIVVMKMYKREEEVLDVLEEKGFSYTYVSRVGREGETVLTDREEILKLRDYMSLIIASRD